MKEEKETNKEVKISSKISKQAKYEVWITAHFIMSGNIRQQPRTCIFLCAEFMLKVMINTSFLKKKADTIHLKNWDVLKDVNEFWGME